MRSGLPGAMVAVGALILGCGAPALEAAGLDDGIPLRVPPRPAPPPPPVEEPEATPPAPVAPGTPASPCPLQWTPKELHGSVFVLPAELNGRMMIPLYRALCACTRPGQRLAMVARLVPEHGEVTAQTVDRPDEGARASRSIDACLATELGAGRYPPFSIGSDPIVHCDPPPAPSPPGSPPEPRHLQAPRPVGCGPEEDRFTIITMPLHVDRRDER